MIKFSSEAVTDAVTDKVQNKLEFRGENAKVMKSPSLNCDIAMNRSVRFISIFKSDPIPPSGQPRFVGFLQGSQEFKEGLFILGRETPKGLRDLACLAAVTQNSIKERHRSTVVQQPGA